MGRRRVANPLALAVLGCLAERPMHPYEMSATMRGRGKHESIKLNYGSLYTVVESLQKHGLIAVRETVREGRRPERTVYEITDAGRLEFTDWLSELISTPVKEYAAYEAGLSLIGGLRPGRGRAGAAGRARCGCGPSWRPAGRCSGRRPGSACRGCSSSRATTGRASSRPSWRSPRSCCGSIEDGSLGGVEAWREAHRRFVAGEEVEPFPLTPE